MSLVPCPDCGRHLLEREARCPFCHRPAPATGWLGAAALAAGLTLTAGCPEALKPAPSPPVAKYGAPPVGRPDPTPPATQTPQPTPAPTPPAPAYGVPPPDQIAPPPPK